MKKLISVVLAIIMIISVPVSTSALVIDPTVQPLWNTMASARIAINFLVQPVEL